MTLSQTWCQPVTASNKSSIVAQGVQVIGASLFIALCAQIRIPLFFTPVPITCQTMAVMLMGALLGSKKGALAVVLYLLEAACGLPVLAKGNCGIFNLFGPTGGYLVGFIVQSYLIGKYFEQKVQVNSTKALFVLILSCFLQMSFGVLWLAQFVGTSRVMVMGFYPFIPGEVIKSFAVTTYLKYRMNRRS